MENIIDYSSFPNNVLLIINNKDGIIISENTQRMLDSFIDRYGMDYKYFDQYTNKDFNKVLEYSLLSKQNGKNTTFTSKRVFNCKINFSINTSKKFEEVVVNEDHK